MSYEITVYIFTFLSLIIYFSKCTYLYKFFSKNEKSLEKILVGVCTIFLIINIVVEALTKEFILDDSILNSCCMIISAVSTTNIVLLISILINIKKNKSFLSIFILIILELFFSFVLLLNFNY